MPKRPNPFDEDEGTSSDPLLAESQHYFDEIVEATRVSLAAMRESLSDTRTNIPMAPLPEPAPANMNAARAFADAPLEDMEASAPEIQPVPSMEQLFCLDGYDAEVEALLAGNVNPAEGLNMDMEEGSSMMFEIPEAVNESYLSSSDLLYDALPGSSLFYIADSLVREVTRDNDISREPSPTDKTPKE